MRPEAAHAPGVCLLAGHPLGGPLLALAHAREVDARAAQTTTAAGRTVRKTTAVPAPVSSAHCSRCWAAAGGGGEIGGAGWGGRRPAGPPRIRPSKGHPGSHRRTATDSRDAAV